MTATGIIAFHGMERMQRWGGDFFVFGRNVRQRVLQWVEIPCGAGFAKSKTLAKIANHIGKKRPTRVFVMPDDSRPVLEKLPISEPPYSVGAFSGFAVIRARR